MSQSATDERAEESGEDSTAEMLIDLIGSTDEFLQSVTETDTSEMSDSELVKLRNGLKSLEDTVEETRKEKAESELENRVEPGEKLLGLHRVVSHNKYVDDDPSAVITRAAKQGIQWSQFVELNASELADVAPDLAEIGKYEYTYFR